MEAMAASRRDLAKSANRFVASASNIAIFLRLASSRLALLT